MNAQIPLLPISNREVQETAFRLADLMAEEEDAIEVFNGVKDEHKDHLSALRKEMKTCRRQLRLARQQREALSDDAAQQLMAQVEV